MTDLNFPNGLTPNYIAPFSGNVTRDMVANSLATLPVAKAELRLRWNSINETRPSGFCPVAEGGPLDDAVREGTWHPELQVDMPTAGGLPGSRGVTQEWPYQKEDARPTAAQSSGHSMWFSGGGWTRHGAGASFGKGQTVFRVWANSGAKIKTWRENGYERWQGTPKDEDGAKKTDEHNTIPGQEKLSVKVDESEQLHFKKGSGKEGVGKERLFEEGAGKD